MSHEFPGGITVFDSRYWSGVLPIEGQKYSGQWMATRQGRLFALDRMRVPSHVLVFDARTFGYDGSRLVSVREALGERFNYDELMAELPRSAVGSLSTQSQAGSK